MSNLIQTIETDLKAAWGDLVGVVEKDALNLWGDFKSIFTAMMPSQYSILSGLVIRALADVETGDIADIETNLLMKAETEELAWVAQLGSAILQAIIAVIKASAPAAPVKS